MEPSQCPLNLFDHVRIRNTPTVGKIVEVISPDEVLVVFPTGACARTFVTHLELIPKKEFTKFDDGKRKYHLLPLKAVEELTRVLEYGAKKYSANNWRKCEDLTRYKDAAFRHLFAYMAGENVDSESGIKHLSHCLCNLAFLVELDEESNPQPNP